jgi:hypothetical protein
VGSHIPWTQKKIVYYEVLGFSTWDGFFGTGKCGFDSDLKKCYFKIVSCPWLLKLLNFGGSWFISILRWIGCRRSLLSMVPQYNWSQAMIFIFLSCLPENGKGPDSKNVLAVIILADRQSSNNSSKQCRILGSETLSSVGVVGLWCGSLVGSCKHVADT